MSTPANPAKAASTDPKASPEPPLYQICRDGRARKVRKEIKRLNGKINDIHHYPVLLTCVKKRDRYPDGSPRRNLLIARELLIRGADPNALYEGVPLLILFSQDSSYKFMKLLLEFKANVNVKHPLTGNTALHHIASHRVKDHVQRLCFELLKKYGADPNVKNSAGMSPLAQVVPTSVGLQAIIDFKPQIDDKHLKVIISCLSGVQVGRDSTIANVLELLSTQQLLSFLKPTLGHVRHLISYFYFGVWYRTTLHRLESSGLTAKKAAEALKLESNEHFLLQVVKQGAASAELKDVDFAGLLLTLSSTGFDLGLKDKDGKDILQHIVRHGQQRALPTSLSVLLQFRPHWVRAAIPSIASIIPKHSKLIHSQDNLGSPTSKAQMENRPFLSDLPSDIIRLIMLKCDIEDSTAVACCSKALCDAVGNNTYLWHDLLQTRLPHLVASSSTSSSPSEAAREGVLSAQRRVTSWRTHRLQNPRSVKVPNTNFIMQASWISIVRKDTVFLQLYNGAMIIDSSTGAPVNSWSNIRINPTWSSPVDDNLLATAYGITLDLVRAASGGGETPQSVASIPLPTRSNQLADLSKRANQIATSSGSIIDLAACKITQQFDFSHELECRPLFSRFNDSLLHVVGGRTLSSYDLRAAPSSSLIGSISFQEQERRYHVPTLAQFDEYSLCIVDDPITLIDLKSFKVERTFRLKPEALLRNHVTITADPTERRLFLADRYVSQSLIAWKWDLSTSQPQYSVDCISTPEETLNSAVRSSMSHDQLTYCYTTSGVESHYPTGIKFVTYDI